RFETIAWCPVQQPIGRLRAGLRIAVDNKAAQGRAHRQSSHRVSGMSTTREQNNAARVFTKIRLDQRLLDWVHEHHKRYLETRPGGHRAVLRQCELDGLDFRGMDFTDSELLVCRFTGANLRGATFRRANLWGAIFENADLSGADFERADLRGAKVVSANLTDTHLAGADLREGMVIAEGALIDPDHGSSFRSAILRGTNMSQSKLKAADFSGALLDG